MKRLLIITAFFLALASNSHAQNDLAAQAEKAYSGKHYAEAIKDYEMLVSQGSRSDKLFYNLGNAYYRNNQLGKAIYNYELAHRLNPADEDINTNLAIANSKTIDKIDAKTNFFANVLKARVVNSLDTTQWAWCSIGSLTLALLLLFFFIYTSEPWLRKTCFFTGVLFACAFIISLSLGFVAKQDKEELSFAVVLDKESKVYGEPQTGDKSKFSLHEGTRVKVLDNRGDWTSIKLENGNEGWIKTDELGLF